MGCGVSKVDGNGVSVPAKFQTHFSHRIEDIKKKRLNRSHIDTTPSKKELLRDEDGPLFTNGRKNTSSAEDIASCVTSENSKSKHENTKQGEKEGSSPAGKEAPNEEDKEIEKKLIYSVVAKEEVKYGEDGDDNDYDERRIGHEGEGIFPGSPSFKVYFDDNPEVEDEKDNKRHTDDGCIQTAKIAEIPLSKESLTMTGKKGKKRRSFRKVMPKGGLLNVGSCYSLAHSSHDRTHLLKEKTPT